MGVIESDDAATRRSVPAALCGVFGEAPSETPPAGSAIESQHTETNNELVFHEIKVWLDGAEGPLWQWECICTVGGTDIADEGSVLTAVRSHMAQMVHEVWPDE